jgi:coenzyme F420-reducing hydrogenase alpha subunit
LGLSQIEAARGRLIHRVALRGRRVSRYQIVSPTAWNFHPVGPAAEGLRRVVNNDPEGVPNKAALLIEAIDPCVQYQLTVQRER